MKQGWKLHKLSELCSSSNGLWKGKKEPFITVGVLRSTNFTKDCKLKLDDVAYIEVEEKSFSKRKLQKNDIVVERSGGGPNQPVGRVLLFDLEADNFSFCNFTSALRVIDQSVVLPKYLYVFLSYFYLSGQTVEMQSNTIGLRNLDYSKYLDIDIPVPSLSEQQRIVDILDAEFAKIDALKENAEKNLQNAKDLFQAVLRKELEPKEGWDKKSIDEVVSDIFSGGDAPKDNMSKEPTEKYCVPIYANAVENDGLYGYTDYSRVHQPSITVSARGSGTGHTLRRYDSYLPIVRLIVIIPNSDIVLLDYIYYSLRSVKIDISGSAIPQLTVPMLKKHEVNYPVSLKEQQRIVSVLDDLSVKCCEIENNYKRSILLCNDLKQALLRKAFNGEL